MGLYIKDGKWCYRFQIKRHREFGNTQIPFNGKTDELGKILENGSNRKIADKIFQKDRINFIEGKKFEYASSITLKNLLERYIEKPEVKKQASYSTAKLPAVKWLIEFFGATILAAHLLKDDIDKWHEWMTEKKKNPIAGNTFNRYLSVASAAFEMAIRDKILKENPCKNVYRYDEDKFRRQRIVPVETLRVIWEKCSALMRDIIIFAITTGMRKGEIRNLEWTHFDLENGVLAIPDNKEGNPNKIVVLKDDVLALVKRRSKVGKYVFCDTDGNKLKKNGLIRTEFDRIKEQLAIKDLRFHDLRHIFGTEFYKSTRDLKAVSNQLGHSDIQITSRTYTNLDVDYMRKQLNKMPSYLSSFEATSEKKCHAGGTLNTVNLDFSRN